MNLTIIAILRMALAAALLPLAALARAAPAPTCTPTPAPPPTYDNGQADCSPHPFDIMSIYALRQSVVR